MFLAMNRFKIAKGFEHGFEKVWKERDSYLKEVEGFISFNLLRCTEATDFVLYASHSVWESEQAFEAWTRSDHFRKAHAQASAPKGTYLAHPDLELFTAVL
jgi:heme-degrading monooxygenase HmoA